jgi:hypothetical protein
MSLSTPVAFIIFNRPDLTQIVFEAIRQAQPPQLLVIADGARVPEEIEKCQRARDIIKQVDWECEVLTNFWDTNMGCKVRVSSGLDWVFSQVEEAIILEDDCLPSPSFFSFCQTLLERYRYDERIMNISGDNFQLGQTRSQCSYHFSRYPHIWGWATWRRAWKHYDVDMELWIDFKSSSLFRAMFDTNYEWLYWLDIFNSVYLGEIDTWDYQWYFCCWIQSALSIEPSVNLVSNLGFRWDATHVKEENSLAKLPVSEILSIVHPAMVTRNNEADNYTFEFRYNGRQIKLDYSMAGQMKRKYLNTKHLTKKLILKMLK